MKKNKHGHSVFTITGKHITGEQEINRLTDAGFCVTDVAQKCFRSDEYNRSHQLQDGHKYQIVLVPGREIDLNISNCTHKAMQKYAEKFGYQKPPAGVMPRICEEVTKTMMETMRISDIVALHKYIKVENCSHVLGIFPRPDKGSIGTYWGDPGSGWNFGTTFAFLEK